MRYLTTSCIRNVHVNLLRIDYEQQIYNGSGRDITIKLLLLYTVNPSVPQRLCSIFFYPLIPWSSTFSIP